MARKSTFLVTIQAIALFVGTIIGAGILGIPYSLAHSGFGVGLFVLVVVGVMVMFLHLFVGEMVLRVKERHQLPGYAGYFLGPWAKNVFGGLMIFGAFGALIAYVIGVGESLAALFGGIPLWWGVGFSLVFSYFLYRGLNLIKSFEVFLLGILFFVVFVIAFLSRGYIDQSNFIVGTISFDNIFLPYGVALFAFGGMSALRPVREILQGHEKNFKKVIIISSLIPLFLYIFFAYIVVGVTGSATTEVATLGLGKVIGPVIFTLGNLFAIFAIGTSFLTIGLSLKETFMYDYSLSSRYAWLLTVFIPLTVYILGVHSFIKVLGLVGAIGGGLQGIFIVFMYWRSSTRGNRKPEFDVAQHWVVGTILLVMFLSGIFFGV